MKRLDKNINLFDSYLEELKGDYGLKKINGKWEVYQFPQKTIIKFEDKNQEIFQSEINEFIKEFAIYDFFKTLIAYTPKISYN